MADKSDLDKIKEKLNLGGLVGSIKSMINPAGGVPTVDPDDDLGLKIAEICTLLKQMVDAQNEHVKKLNKINGLLNVVFQDIEVLRNEVKSKRDKKATENPSSTDSVKQESHPDDSDKKE